MARKESLRPDTTLAPVGEPETEEARDHRGLPGVILWLLWLVFILPRIYRPFVRKSARSFTSSYSAADVLAPTSLLSTQTVFGFMNSWMPKWESSRP